jgi:hypothetical protein
LDTACSLALLQEVINSTGRKEHRRPEQGVFNTLPGKSIAIPLPFPPTSGRMSGLGEERRNSGTLNIRNEEGKMVALKAYRKAKGLCFKCGENGVRCIGMPLVYHYIY